MSQIITLDNFSNLLATNVVGRTILTADIAASVNSLPVENSADFTAGPVLVGQPAGESTELVTATTPSTVTAVPLSANTKLAHNFNDVVLMLYGDKIRLYSAADVYANGTQPPDANFTLLATIAINGADQTTSYTDSTSAATVWYKYTFYNSITSTETPLAYSRAFQAPATAHYVSIAQVRSSAGLDGNTHIGDAKIAEFIDAAEREVDGALGAVYSLPLPAPTNPIVVQITKNIAAGELMQEVYTTTSPKMVDEGRKKASHGRDGDGLGVTGLAQLVNRDVVLQDANYLELTIDESHALGGWPDGTTNDASYTLGNQDLGQQGMDHGSHFWIDKEY